MFLYLFLLLTANIFLFIASAPTRTLGQRKLVRNRFTIDTDIVFDTDADAESPDSQSSLQPGDTDRWVEEQFDLQCYEEQEHTKETDMISDENEDGNDEDLSLELEDPITSMSLEEHDSEKNKSDGKDCKTQHALKLSDVGKQCAMSVASVDEQLCGEEVIWVRRNNTTDTQNEFHSWKIADFFQINKQQKYLRTNFALPKYSALCFHQDYLNISQNIKKRQQIQFLVLFR